MRFRLVRAGAMSVAAAAGWLAASACYDWTTTPGDTGIGADDEAGGGPRAEAGPDGAADVEPDRPAVMDGAGDALLPAEKYVFVSSQKYSANLDGLMGADGKCQTLARNATPPLPGTYMAWLSDTEASAATRLTHANVPYVLPGTHVHVAEDWADLVSGMLRHAIDTTESGVALLGTTAKSCDNAAVWTSTAEDGALAGFYDCQGWRAETTMFVSGGSISELQKWSTGCASLTCEGTSFLYCLEQ